MAKLTLYIDCVSPYGFFAFHVLETYRHIWKDVDIDYIPIVLGIVMKESGNRAPIAVPNKGKWLQLDIARTKDELGLGKFEQPKGFPYNSFPAMRALLALKHSESDDDYRNCCRALWRAGWTNHRDMSDPQTWIEAFSDVVSLERAKKYAAQSGDKAIKDELIRNTKEVLSQDAFGLPWFKIEKDGKVETFFGNDRWVHITTFMGVEWKGLEFCQETPNAKL